MKTFYRIIFYIAGMLILALGLSLNTLTGMGASPIISLPFFISRITNLNFGNLTFLLYVLLVIVQLMIKGKERQWKDLLEIVYSILFTRILNIYTGVLPAPESLSIKILYIAGAVVFTGIGAAMVLNTRWTADPCDAFVHALGQRIHIDTDLMKNIVDFTFAMITLVLSLLLQGKIIGVGIGTIIAAAGVGRIIWLYNKLFFDKTERLCF